LATSVILVGEHGLEILSPFEAEARQVLSFSTRRIAAMYFLKCEVDVTPYLAGHGAIDLYECRRTGYRFWRPEEVAGKDEFYHELSKAWPGYYRTSRWEYEAARRPAACVLRTTACWRSVVERATS
jgi:hypothetical protein